MSHSQQSWICVTGSNAKAIQDAILEHAALIAPSQPRHHRMQIAKLANDRFAVTFQPPTPPYEFTNLIAWLDDALMTQGSKGAVGWLVAPDDGQQYYLVPDHGNPSGDTLLGITAGGKCVSVYLPECSVTAVRKGGLTFTAPDQLPVVPESITESEVVLDTDTSFGNPQFVVE